MSHQESNAYILGTETAELHRLGLQHQVWASEAIKGWDLAGFTAGHTLLDMGCGPGFCTTELAYIAGDDGKVIGIDKSKTYLEFLDRVAKIYQLNIETIEADFLNVELEPESIDAVYSRWALAWDKDVTTVIQKVVDAMRPGASFVSHESGLEVISTRLMAKLATPESSTWQWPKSFLNIYLPKLIGTETITADEVDAALGELDELEYIDGATIFTPQMVEVVAVKV